MKKYVTIVLSALILASLLSACGSKNTLSGSYTADSILSETTYTFAKDGSVTLRLTAASYVVIDDAKGTYSLNEDGTQITFSFPESTKDLGSLSFDIPALSGDFAFSKGENYIQIGNMQYNKVS